MKNKITITIGARAGGGKTSMALVLEEALKDFNSVTIKDGIDGDIETLRHLVNHSRSVGSQWMKNTDVEIETVQLHRASRDHS